MNQDEGKADLYPAQPERGKSAFHGHPRREQTIQHRKKTKRIKIPQLSVVVFQVQKKVFEQGWFPEQKTGRKKGLVVGSKQTRKSGGSGEQ